MTIEDLIHLTGNLSIDVEVATIDGNTFMARCYNVRGVGASAHQATWDCLNNLEAHLNSGAKDGEGS